MYPIFKEFDIPIYRSKFLVLFSDKKEEIEAFCPDDRQGFELHYAHTFIVNFKKHEGFLVTFNLKNEFRSVNHGCIAHEVFHAASMLLRSRDVELSVESEEAYSYLIDWMTDLIYGTIKENKIEIV